MVYPPRRSSGDRGVLQLRGAPREMGV